MSSSENSIKDLLGQSTPIRFHVPVEDAQLNYDATFGPGEDLSEKVSLIVTGLGTIKLYAAFKGLLVFSPPSSADLSDSILGLCIAPTEALALTTLLPEGTPMLNWLVYAPVDQSEVEKAILKELTVQGLTGSKLNETQKGFLTGGLGVLVDAGVWIGTAPDGSVAVCFCNEDGYMLHPRYLLWLLWKSASTKGLVFEPANHGLIQALQLSSSNLLFENDTVTLPDAGGTEQYSLLIH